MVDEHVKVPIIKAHKDQELIVLFTKDENGKDVIKFGFAPNFDPAKNDLLPTEHAAVFAAKTILEAFQEKPDEVVADGSS